MRLDKRKTNPKYDPPARAMTIPTENLDAMIQFLTDVSETSGDHFMRAADMLRAQQARVAELERGSPRCECCGYLVHEREHLGCIRAAAKMAAPKPATVAVDARAMAELLEQAAEDIQEWGAYASAYFQEKHNLAANVAKYREAARRLLAGGQL